nr:hypothetical protein [Candidatus Coxiella mudrowiae]
MNDNIKEAPILARAAPKACDLNKETVSKLKLEKVVNHPKKPIKTPARQAADKANRPTNMPDKIPIRKEPIRLTTKIPQEKFLGKISLTEREIRKQDKEPIESTN